MGIYIGDNDKFKGQLVIWRQEVVSMDATGDVIIVMVCPPNSNPINNVSCTRMPLPRIFHDHESKYAASKGDARRRTLEELTRLINCYLPNDWALALVELSSTIQAIGEEGFKGTQILAFDNNSERSMRLFEWVR